MRKAYTEGVSFGLTSGVITTLGLLIGVHSATNSKLAVIGGIFSIAIADALSDAMGMHAVEEATGRKTKSIWEATLATFCSKFFFALSFIIPIILFELHTAIYAAIAWAALLISILGYRIAKTNKENPIAVITEHLALTLVVVILTYYVGTFVATYFDGWF